MFEPIAEIIVTSYKNPKYLRECLLSLQAQELSDFKVTIVDNASPENVLQEIGDIVFSDSRFTFHQNESNNGEHMAFQKYSRLGNSKYVMWLHHDDWIHPTFLKKAISALEQQDRCPFSYSLCSRVINGVPRDEFPNSIRPSLPTGYHDLSYDTVINCWIMWSSALIRRSSLFAIGGLESMLAHHHGRTIDFFRMGEFDLFIFAKLSQLDLVHVINERLCFYRDHESSASHNIEFRKTHIQDNIRTYDFIFDGIDFFSDEVRAVSKINSVGRLITGDGIASTAAKLLLQGRLSIEFRAHRRVIAEKLLIVLDRLIIDNFEKGYPKYCQDWEIEQLKKCILEIEQRDG